MVLRVSRASGRDASGVRHRFLSSHIGEMVLDEAQFTRVEYRIDRADLRAIEEVERPLKFEDGQILVRVGAFAFTANNITYAAFGEEMAYWQFFPTDDGYGLVPVWGFAEVVRSRCPAIAVGERLYGYWPMATHAVLTPGRIGDHDFVDTAQHRAALPPAYNSYLRWSGLGRGDDERAYMLFRPLYVTSFLIDDWLAGERWFGARSVVLTSASSKTALGLAQSIKAREDSAETIALTSPGNVSFVQQTGYYDRVIAYPEVSALDDLESAVIVDFAGDGALRASLHKRLGERLKYDCVVGAAHWEDRGPQQRLPGPAPTFFFAPSRLVERVKQWGSDVFNQRLDASWDSFIASTHPWLRFEEARGGGEIVAAYHRVIDGGVDPATGQIFHPV